MAFILFYDKHDTHLYLLRSTSFYSYKYDACPCHLFLYLFQYHCYYLEHSLNAQQDLTSWTSCKNIIGNNPKLFYAYL